MSHVRSTGLLSPEQAALFFEAQLACRTDAADLAAGHIPGAISLPHREMVPERVAELDRDAIYVCYCDGIGCNGSTRGAYKLARLGFRVKELIGGLHWWQRDGFAVALGDEPGQLANEEVRCGC